MVKPSGESMVGGNVIAMWEGFVYIGKASIYVYGLFNNLVYVSSWRPCMMLLSPLPEHITVLCKLGPVLHVSVLYFCLKYTKLGKIAICNTLRDCFKGWLSLKLTFNHKPKRKATVFLPCSSQKSELAPSPQQITFGTDQFCWKDTLPNLTYR